MTSTSPSTVRIGNASATNGSDGAARLNQPSTTPARVKASAGGAAARSDSSRATAHLREGQLRGLL